MPASRPNTSATYLLRNLLLIASLAGGAGDGALAQSDGSRVEWLESNAVSLGSADPKEWLSPDLEPVAAALAGVRVVALAEASRGDGTTFLAKIRLIRFLHETLGFDVVAFECGIHACGRAWADIEGGADVESTLRDVLLGFYGQAEQLSPLAALVEQRLRTERPLEIAGFDSMITGSAGVDRLFEDLRLQISTTGGSAELSTSLDAVESVTRKVAMDDYATGAALLPSRRERKAFERALETLTSYLAKTPDRGTEPSAWDPVLASMRASAQQAWQLGRYRTGQTIDPQVQNSRSAQMASNLLWLANERYPGRKIILWSTSIHLARNLDRLRTGDTDLRERLGQFSVLGDRVEDAFGDEFYAIAFTAAEGSKGTAFGGAADLLQPTRGAFEDLMHRTGLGAAFVDLKSFPQRPGGGWLGGLVVARPISHVELQAVWPRHLDGLVFLRDMSPVKRYSP